jgi:hypothetical protein
VEAASEGGEAGSVSVLKPVSAARDFKPVKVSREFKPTVDSRDLEFARV